VQEINDPMVLTGQTEAKITIDFSKLEDSDARGDSYYVVGGRAYFEADVLGLYTTSFTAKGFFDRLGYVEPSPEDPAATLLLTVGLPVGILVLVLVVVAYCCYSRKKRANNNTNAAQRRSSKTIHID
jgi:hypothetical protein